VIRSIAVLVIVTCLTRTSYAENSVQEIETHRLGSSELQSWIAKEFRAGGPIRFASNEGQGLCCDVGSITLEIRRNHTITIAINTFAGYEFTLPYIIQVDGKISLASNSAYPVPALQNSDIRDVYVYRYGSSVYVDRDSTVHPDLASRRRSIWPLKYVSHSKH
jgi:hypothetical protein